MMERMERMEDLPMRPLAPPAAQAVSPTTPQPVEQQQGQQEQGAANTRLPVPATSVDMITLAERAKYGAGALLGVGGVTEIIGMGGTGILLALIAGGTVAYFSEEVRGLLIDILPAPKQNKSRASKVRWFITGQNAPTSGPAQEVIESGEPNIDELEGEDIYGAFVTERQDSGVRRLTVSEIIQHTDPNSYTIVIGRSLTKPGNPPIRVGFYKHHFKFIGASQKGKSSMAAVFLHLVTRTHDYQHVLVALLDWEDQTSKLFANVPHLAKVRVPEEDGQPSRVVPLHARTREQVVAYLNYIIRIVDDRYTYSKQEILRQPIMLVYVEEFLQLKNWLRKQIDSAPDEAAKKRAKKMYADFTFAISEIAARGLKVRVQLLLCAQVDYRDDDKELQEALINIDCGMSFAVRTTAAQAAGFYNYELLQRNALESFVGQAVVEMPDCKDLVLAPDFDLEKRLVSFEEAEAAQEPQAPSRRDHGMLTAAGQDGTQQPGSPMAAGQASVVTTKLEETLEQILAKLSAVEAGGENRFQGRDTDADGEPATPSKYKRALEVWISNDGNNGNFSVSDFAKAMDNMERSTAYRLLVEMESKGMIDRPKREKAEK
jgi:hypothetical protein